MSGRHVTRYRGQEITRNDNVNPGRRGRYTWSGREFAQLNHAKGAIDDHFSELNSATDQKENTQ